MTPPAAGSSPLTRTERALLRCVGAQGGPCTDGYAALATAIDAGERSVQRAARRLASNGLLRIVRRGPKATELVLTPAGNRRLTEILPRQSADRPIGRSAVTSSPPAAIVAPAGFMGDKSALAVARIEVRIRRSENPSDLAVSYLEHADPAEQRRLLGLLDESGNLPISERPTTYFELDEGLRIVFNRRAKRERHARSVKAALQGVRVHGVDDEE